MAGGFKMQQMKWLRDQAGSTTVERAQYILSGVANLLITTGLWEIDTSHHPGGTTTEFMTGNSNTIHALFLKSTVFESGHTPEKLMIGYSTGTNVVPAPFGFRYNQNYMFSLSGLFYSMIPADSSAVFGNTWLGEGFIPGEATLVGGPASYDNGTSASYTMAGVGTTTSTFHAQVITNGHIIAFRMYRDSNYGHLGIIGPIIATLAHPSVDNLSTSKMLSMAIYSSRSSSSYPEGNGYLNSYDSSFFYDYINSSRVNMFNQIEFFNAENKHIQSENGHGIFYDSSSSLNSDRVSNSSITGFNRWTAIYIGVHSSDPTSHYVVMGDGMKGYLDTNFIRHVRAAYTFGQTFDDGNFVYIGNGIALGWDPTNGPLNDT